MDRSKVFETETFQEDLVQIGRSGLGKIAEKLREHVYPQLRVEPHHGPYIKRLKQWTPSTWRYRIGAWRFFFEIDEADKIVYLTAADHRSRSYW